MKLSKYSRIKWEIALNLKKSGAYQEAEKELKEALEEDPDNFLLNASLAELYLRQGKSTEAKILAESILILSPSYSQALYVIGEILFKEKKFEEALQYFKQASQKDHRPYPALRMAITLRKMNRLQDALDAVNSVLADERENLRFLKEKALILNRMKRFDKALGIYENVRQLDPKDNFVRKEIIRLKGRKQPDLKVINELKKVVTISSGKDDPQLHGLLGEKLKKAGKFNEAASEFRNASRLDPDNQYFLRHEGFCYYKLGKDEEALRTLGRVYKKDPDDYIVRSTLKKIYTTKKDIDGFIKFLEEVLKSHPNNVKLIGSLKKLKKDQSIANQ